MYAPWAFYTGIWALYNPKLPIWPLIGLPDLAGDHFHSYIVLLVMVIIEKKTNLIMLIPK